MSGKRSKKIAAFFLGVYILLVAAVGTCETADSFKTPEYYNSTGLSFINAASAYSLGYTGLGVVLGICDDYVRLTHPEFIKKWQSGYVDAGPEDGYDWQQGGHGSHVAGIMAAAKDNVGMQGLAFDADIMSGTYYYRNYTILKSTYDAFNQNSRVRVINNSWGLDFYPDEINEGKQNFINRVNSYQDMPDSLSILARSITDYDKVLVFAAGNAGHSTPGGNSLLPYLYPETAGNFINVVALNSSGFSDDAATAKSNSVAVFSDLTKYVEENSISAPGVDINSVEAGSDGYTLMSGTSMAAPYVTAATGLVQQDFPYMTGKQLTDTILSTANNTFTLPRYTLTVQEDFPDPTITVDRSSRVVKQINLYYFGSKPDQAGQTADLTGYYNENKDT
ncbi:MAG TPA: S8 family peptidase, partial [Patescibacteria group bacterium]|nr:S8 family peptidase [Patescibacteria group bacterium]